jgi:hypothetical protein
MTTPNEVYELAAKALEPIFGEGKAAWLSKSLPVRHAVDAVWPAAFAAGGRAAAEAIAHNIRAELVCCDIYDRDAGTERAGQTHAICFWGEAGARIAEGSTE